MALFGLTPSKKEPAKDGAPQSGFVFDVSTQEFETRVMQASMQKPVLVDFWAPWCGPCKQLMPVLEAEVAAANGDVLLAKVNIDENPELAQALRIQSVPTVMAFYQGQPVTGFTGARPASEIKYLIAQLVKLAGAAKPGALDVPAVLKNAAAQAAAGNVGEAQALFAQVLQQDPNNADAYIGLMRTVIDSGDLAEAQGLLDSAPDAIAQHPNFISVKTALEIAKGAGEANRKLKPLYQKVEANPGDHEARFELAKAEFAAGKKEEAIDNFLVIIKAERGWNADAARIELLRCFEAMGFADPLSVEGRKKLSRLLFS